MTASEPPVLQVVEKLLSVGCTVDRRSSAKWDGQCPAHDDSHPSLSITVADDGKVLIHCFAGCDVKEILKALGMTVRDLFPMSRSSGLWKPSRGAKVERPPADPYDKTFGYIPACILERGCITCIALYSYYALRCGSDNRRQHGWKPVADKLGINWRTAKGHAEYLAGLGWLHIKATTTPTGAHKAVEVWLAHCLPLKIIGSDVRPPDRDHMSRRSDAETVVQPLHPQDDSVATTDVCGQLDSPTTVVGGDSDCRTSDVPRLRYVGSDGSEVMDTYAWEVDSEEQDIAPCAYCGIDTALRDDSGEPWCASHEQDSACR